MPLYKQMMQSVFNSDYVYLLKQIIALVTIVYRPVTLKELISLIEGLEGIEDDKKSWSNIIGLCGSFFILRECTIYFVHQSAKDFMLQTVSADIFPSGKATVHNIVFQGRSRP